MTSTEKIVFNRAVELVADGWGMTPEQVIDWLNDDAEMKDIDNRIKSREAAHQEGVFKS